MKSSRVAIAAPIVLVSIALMLTAFGCTKHEDPPQAAATQAAPQVVAASVSGTSEPMSTGSETTGASEDYATVSGDSLPPEVMASVTDTLIAPGEVVDLVAEGSADVVEVILADGVGRKQRFAYDYSADVWRTSYRVPIKAPVDPIGLSVTARNASGRWRRVWVFLSVPPKTAATMGPAVEEK